MTPKHSPKLRITTPHGHTILRESINFTFFMRSAQEIAGPATAKALDIYLQAIGGPQELGLYPDSEGEWQPLDDEGWAYNRKQLLGQTGCWVMLRNADPLEERFAVMYRSWTHGPLSAGGEPDSACAVSFWLPTEFLEEHGPQHTRSLAKALAASLPFSSGYGGLAFHCDLHLSSIPELLRPLCFRYPGIDMIDLPLLSRYMGERLRASSWLTFLGPTAVEQLSGGERLRGGLTTPGTTVESLETNRLLVSLGDWPEAGDMRHGETLPAYREFARILEPRLFHKPHFRNILFPPEEWHKWERRFLD